MKQNLLLLNQEQEILFSSFIEEFLLWNKTHNLISKRDSKDLWERHIYESIVLAQFFPIEKPILDIGSGNGFPGLIFSLLGLAPHMCEIISKKATFLKYMLFQFKLLGRVLNEDVFSLQQTYSFFSSRAFSSLTNILKVQKALSEKNALKEQDFSFLDLSKILKRKEHDFSEQIEKIDLKNIGPYGVYSKGPSYKAEIEEAKKTFTFDCYEFQVSEKNHILVIANLEFL